MMGRLKSDQGQLFYEFHLGDAVPEDHLVRKIDAALDLSWLRSELAPHYSERLICREVQVNLAYRWFCRLGIEDAIPDHSAFSRARNERFREGEVFRRVFGRVVEVCIAAGLVGGEGFAVDASLIAADANKQRSIAGQDWRRDRDPARSSRAVKEYLATLDDTAWGAASDVVPKFISPSDPAAMKRLMHCSKMALLFDHLVGASEERRRDSEPDRLRGFQIDDEFVLVRLLDR
jgi:Transposase domain (DUF772)